MTCPETLIIDGTVPRFYAASNGWGMITPDDPGIKPVMFHASALRAAGHQFLPAGTRVRCHAVMRANGLQAFRFIQIAQSLT